MQRPTTHRKKKTLSKTEFTKTELEELLAKEPDTKLKKKLLALMEPGQDEFTQFREFMQTVMDHLTEVFGITAQGLADYLGVGLRTTQRWESTHTPPVAVQAWILDRWAHYAEIVSGYVEHATTTREPITLRVFRNDESAFAVYGMNASEATALVGHIAMSLEQRDFNYQIIAG